MYETFQARRRTATDLRSMGGQIVGGGHVSGWGLLWNITPLAIRHVPEVCNEIDPDRSAYEKSVAEIQYPAVSGRFDV